MSTAGGDSWDTAGVLTDGAVPVTHRVDMNPGYDATSGYAWAAWWTLTVTEDSFVTLDGRATTAPVGGNGAAIDLFTGSSLDTATWQDEDYRGPKLSFIATAGVTYHVTMGTWSDDGSGIDDYLMTVTIADLVPPANDAIANAEVLPFNVEVDPMIGLATVETGETAIFGSWSTPDRSVWYKFTPTFTGMVGFDLMQTDDGNNGDPEWDVCTGNDLSDVVVVSGGNTFADQFVVVDVTAGTTYLLRVAVRDPDSLFLNLRMQRYSWSDWVQDADVTGISSQGLGGVYEGTVSDDGSTCADGTDLVPVANTLITSLMGTARSAHDAASDSYLTGVGATSIGGFGAQPMHQIQSRVRFNRGGFPVATENVQASVFQRAQTMWLRPYSVPSYNVSPAATPQYESAQPVLTGASLTVKFAMRKSGNDPSDPDPSYLNGTSFAAHGDLYAYVPSVNAVQVDDPYDRRLVASVDATVGSTTPTVEYTITFDEADFAGVTDVRGEAGVIFYALVDAQIPVFDSYEFIQYAIDYFASLRIRDDTSYWTWRPPRRRDRVVIDAPPPSDAPGKFPLRRYPPVGNGGHGPTRHWPRPVNRRAGGTY